MPGVLEARTRVPHTGPGGQGLADRRRSRDRRRRGVHRRPWPDEHRSRRVCQRRGRTDAARGDLRHGDRPALIRRDRHVRRSARRLGDHAAGRLSGAIVPAPHPLELEPGRRVPPRSRGRGERAADDGFAGECRQAHVHRAEAEGRAAGGVASEADSVPLEQRHSRLSHRVHGVERSIDANADDEEVDLPLPGRDLHEERSIPLAVDDRAALDANGSGPKTGVRLSFVRASLVPSLRTRVSRSRCASDALRSRLTRLSR